ncbi:MAG TPA: DUF917 domain-containing protein [Ktedonobacteraceae bacterium]|nr:DUF917 domain-containing protein [Ktedonobacteraceae bacterium]
MSWTLTEQDLYDLTTGAGILGTGGGGNPYLGYLHVRELLRSGARITVMSASTLQETDLICPVGGIGAPTISIERLPNGGEYLGALRTVEAAWGRRVSHVSSIEIGGANALRPLVVAAQAGLPLVDGDGMGRAFPELQMCTFAIADLPITPIALQDVRGNSLLIQQVVNARWAEQIARAATVAMGGSAAMALFCLSAPDYRGTAITGTVSLAVRLGRVVRRARESHQDPLAAILALLPARHLFTGKVVDVERRTVRGFARGRVVLADGAQRIGIDFQNEYLIARDMQSGEALATVPDLICLVHPETGEPLTTEVLRYGSQVAAIAVAAPGPLKSPAALAMVGPQAFGYPDPYRPLPGDLRTAAAEERVA